MTHMNKNCPLEASNLNNPSEQFRLQVGKSHAAAARGTSEMLNTTQLAARVQSLRLAASDRMHASGLEPEESYTFEFKNGREEPGERNSQHQFSPIRYVRSGGMRTSEV